MDVNEEEGFWLSVLRLNKLSPPKEIRREWHWRTGRIVFLWRNKHNLWGRFGGGWQWVLGFEAAPGTVIVNLLICSIRIVYHLKPAEGA